MDEGRRWDVIVVGARCAGSALATFLARSGARVLVVDRDVLPSDQVLSTHTIHPPGADILDELGVGDAVRSVTPRSPTTRLRRDDVHVDVSFPDGRAELCPRREHLDGLLQAAATRAGAELRDRTRATQLLFEGDRVVGVEVQHDRQRGPVRADLVVGADGRHSFVAREVQAEEYMGYDAPRAMFWAYWNAPKAWRSDQYPFDTYLGRIGPDFRVIFQTDNDQLLVGSLPAVDVARSWTRDPRRSLWENLSRDDVIGPLLGGAAPDSSVRGTLKERYFFRRGVGDGWALVGDAGHHKEFIVGDGITEALIQAKGLASAISEGSHAALVRWWRTRDVEAWPGYHWGRDEGSLEPAGQLQSLVFERVARDPRLQRLMTRLPEHQCSPYDALPFGTILSVAVAAILRGRFRVIPEFLAQARRINQYGQSWRERKQLLEQAVA